jgi:DNA repair protein RadD
MLELRPYQAKVLADLWQWFADHDDGDPIIEASVGAGKSVLIAELCRRALAEWPDTRVLMVVHVKELVEQNLAKLLQVWPGAPVGVYSASVGARQLGRAITYATIGSVAKRAHELGRVDLMLVDECHLISPSESTMYRRLIDALRRYNPAMRVVGWTGTAFRGDGIWLTQQGLFSHVAARVTMAELLAAGYLAPLTSAPVETQISTDGVRLTGNDYTTSALAAVSDKADLVRQACAELARLAADRKKWLVFAVTVAHAHHLADELANAHGIACAVVSADTPKAEREALIQRFRRGQLRALVNVAVLTTGFDAPEVDCIALLRATKSPVLYVQIAGRGMRTAPGKADCLWLDFTTTTALLGPVDAIKGRRRPPAREGDAQRGAPFKHCDACGNPQPAAAPACSHCGAVFPEAERVNHAAQASQAAVLSTGPAWTSISRVAYSRHAGKEGKPDSLRVDYFGGFRLMASEWVCIEHTGYARDRARTWWQRRTASAMPATVSEALEQIHTLREPGRIVIQQQGRYAEVVNHEFTALQFDSAIHGAAAHPGAAAGNPGSTAREPAAL